MTCEAGRGARWGGGVAEGGGRPAGGFGLPAMVGVRMRRFPVIRRIEPPEERGGWRERGKTERGGGEWRWTAL